MSNYVHKIDNNLLKYVLKIEYFPKFGRKTIVWFLKRSDNQRVVIVAHLLQFCYQKL